MAKKEVVKTKKSLAERLRDKQADIKSRGKGGDMIFFKEGVTRIRAVPVGKENDWSLEVIYFYLGKDIQGYISPKTFGKKCAVYELYEELKGSKKASDQNFAKNMSPKRRFLTLAVRYKDEKGKEVDADAGAKLALLPNGIFQEMIDLFLDDEGGDFTDPLEGYDLKIKRTGKGKMDTEYSLIKCNPTKLAKAFRGPYNLEEYVKKIMPTYEESQAIAEKFLNLGPEEDSDEAPVKKKKKKKTRGDI